MAKVFYDELIDLEELEKKIKKIARTSDERDELYQLVDEIVHHKVIGCILDKLPENHHEEFLSQLGERPHDEGLFVYLRERIQEDLIGFIKEEVHKLSVELLLYVEEVTRPEEKRLVEAEKPKRKKKRSSKKK